MDRYYLDTEVSGADMITLALVGLNEDDSLYLLADRIPDPLDPWVVENVIPIIGHCPVVPQVLPVSEWGAAISNFIYRPGRVAQIIADWPSDIADFCNLLLTGPGTAVPMHSQTHLTIVRHIDVYPTTLPGAVQHNAWWDAMALKHYVETNEEAAR